MEQRYAEILPTLVSVSSLATETADAWGFVRFNGKQATAPFTEYRALKGAFSQDGFNNIIRLEINDRLADEDDVLAYEEQPGQVLNWQLTVNKLPLISAVAADGWHYNFFLSEANCTAWLNEVNPLIKECPFNNFDRLKIIIEGLKAPFGGKGVQFLAPGKSLDIKEGNEKACNLPERDTLLENIHFITNEDVSINCKSYHIHGQTNSSLEKAFLYKACVALATCLVTEYYSLNKVTIDGIKRLTLSIDDGNANVTYSFYNSLLELIDWIYEDRVSVRKKLFNERLSLDLDPDDTLLKSLTKGISGAFVQAKARYNFVIIDRKDAYLKELKELLKDIRTQSELYSGKIRTLLSNFLRDLLAAIVLVGFTIFTKFNDNEALVNNNLLRYVFWGLAIYYVLSIILQTILDVTDITVSKREILYWKNATKELLPEKEFQEHIDSSLKGRRLSLRIIYPIIVLCYLAIAFACYKFPAIFESLIR